MIRLDLAYVATILTVCEVGIWWLLTTAAKDFNQL